MRMALGDYTMAIAGMKAVVAGKKVAMAKVCVTMKALYGMASTAKLNGRAWVEEKMEVLQRRFARRILGVCKNAANETVQEELGLMSIEGR